MPNFKLWEMGNCIMLDFPFSLVQERQGENACLLKNASLERESYVCTNSGAAQRQFEQIGQPSVAAAGFRSPLLPESRPSLNEFHRYSSECWLFLFPLSTLPTKPFTEATSVVIDCFFVI